MKCGVVIVAAGQGKRLGMAQHKALVPLGGRPIFLHCVEKFSNHPLISHVVVVVHRDDLDTFTTGVLGDQLKALGDPEVVVGGARRQDSVLNGIKTLPDAIESVLVHDAARPFVANRTISLLVEALHQYEAAVPVVPVTSTVKRLQDSGLVAETVSRAPLRLAQTPQAARRDLLALALAQTVENEQDVTDDAQAMELAGHQVVAVEDSRWNFKITTAEDLKLAELILGAGLLIEETA